MKFIDPSDVTTFQELHCQFCIHVASCKLIAIAMKHEDANALLFNGSQCTMKILRRKKPQQQVLALEELPFASDEFKTAWEEWKKHRAALRKPLTPQATKLQLAKLREFGEQLAITSIYYSIERSYQGIYPPPPEAAGQESPDPDMSLPPCDNWREIAEKLLGRRIVGDWRSLERVEHGIRGRILEHQSQT